LDDRGARVQFLGGEEISFISKPYKLAVGLTQTSIHWIIGAVSLEVNLSWCGV
jgi:hypothetical protein